MTVYIRIQIYSLHKDTEDSFLSKEYKEDIGYSSVTVYRIWLTEYRIQCVTVYRRTEYRIQHVTVYSLQSTVYSLQKDTEDTCRGQNILKLQE